MNYLDAAKDQVLGVVNKVVDMQPQRAAAQTVTIACPVERVAAFWRDPAQLSVVLGDIAEVDSVGEDRYRWRTLTEPDLSWESRLVTFPDGVEFVGTSDGNELTVNYRPAPRDLGTEVTLHVKTPAPGMLTGAAAFKLLYRLRALLQTGEVPTIKSNPSARNSAR
ncbi:hypothetical protein MKUB_27330 [Mycobacterium kubicae]|uniref:SRPBCC family protein n=1 Tax=Mycobacterium kubicae TaxID=120959 RepID=A0AAX1J2T8_9MYCO|nr:hypothetical protein [Mycobacterium kubicae]MCV7096099.1 hypothetical protein [Mycobacterium kubicae]OBF17414.1 hypothetical protein A5725_23915 [Mycobacterium kubicae]OBK44017.1 hypothetical protein A5657_04990 [Mycobacterium kubicae]ORV99224.1 hypothetical protein AWC13_10740 [Mycobacterium kubicae]QNI07239.1 hypothetical protein GAN17_13770 [Mycobacterium kubicae]